MRSSLVANSKEAANKQIINNDLLFTYSDYEKIPSDGKKYEVIEGELYMTPAPFSKHQIVLARLFRVLDDYVRKNKLGEVYFAPFDFVLSDINIVQPDLFFISKNRLNIIEEKNIQGPPNLVVEILSPSTKKIDEEHKKNLYEKFGVKEYWIVDTNKNNIEVFILEKNKFISTGIFNIESNKLKSRLFTNIKVNFKKVFE